MHRSHSTASRGLQAEFIRHGTVIFLATVLVNASMFAFHVVLSRALGLAGYGSLYTVISVATFIGVLGGILSIVVARLIAEHRETRTIVPVAEYLAGSAIKQSVSAGFAFCLAIAAVSGPIAGFMHVTLVPVLLLAVFAGGQIVLAGVRGILQGFEEFASLAVSLVFEAFVRTGLAIALVMAGFGVAAAVGAYAIGTLVAIGYTAAAITRRCPVRFGKTGLAVRRVATLSLGVSISTLAIAAAGIVDVVLVRHYFDNATSGTYSAVSLVGKMVYFAVGFIPTIMLPKATANAMRGGRASRILMPASVAIITLSILCCGLFLVFPRFIVTIMVGSQYLSAAPYVFRYGIAMALLGSSNAFVAYRIGVNDFAYVPMAIVLVVVEFLVITFFHTSIEEVVWIVVVSNGALLLSVIFGIGRARLGPGWPSLDPVLVAGEVEIL